MTHPPLAIYTHADCLEHDTGPGHPECADRLRAILDAIRAGPDGEAAPFANILEAPLATEEDLQLAHDAEYVRAVIAAAPSSGRIHLDPDTVMSPGSLRAALRAAGAGLAAVDAVRNGAYTQAFCATRPPGHHATRCRAMGFCLFNSIAIAALHARKRCGFLRVAIVDFDVHHGNGTQDILAGEPGVFYLSTHQSPCYPGTGGAGENREGRLLNLPLPPGTNSARYRSILTEAALPALTGFAPELLLVSAGFDGHRADPLAGMQLTEEDYRWIGEQLTAVANQSSRGRMVAFLEGGYNLDVLGASVLAYLQGCRHGVARHAPAAEPETRQIG